MASSPDQAGGEHPFQPVEMATVYEQDGVTVVTVAGEIDLATSSQLRAQLLDVLTEQEPPRVLVVALDGVSFLDSTGLSALVVARRRAKELGVELRLTSPARGPSRVLNITGLDDAFRIYPTLNEAIAGETAPPA
ncbi:STAS domain-containing protein [Actinopolymorpha sp. B11F2]|uniref:STAS domain-containing protein n=1 Tax=Actinopolymorpha sp. B11F2 TaxID=3160862 RepID=UPI0032E446F8